MATDAEIRAAGLYAVPKSKYLQNEFQLPTNEVVEEETESFGIPNTNAFTNSGGNSFNQSGNAFGYGSQVEPVSYGSYNGPGYTGGLPGNVQQYGQGRQFTGDEEGLGPTTGTNSYDRKVPGFLRTGAAFVPFGNTALNFLEKRMNKDGRGPSNNYGIGGLSEAQKGAYNNLAGQGMLFDGPGGVKTLTGKNFTGKGYMEGQMDLAKGFGFDTMTEEEIEDAINAQGFANQNKFGTKSKGFKYKQMLEASQMYKTNTAQKEKQKEEFNKPGGTGEQVANIQARVDKQYQDQMNRDSRDFSVKGDNTSSNRQGKDNQASSERGYAMHGANGGRAGYFFGGRVNFKNGGLASIL